MSDYIIATASTCDIDKGWLDAHDVPFISYTFTVDGKIYVDDCTEETRRAIYAAMREGKQPNTSQITTYNYYEFFKRLCDTGKPVVFVDMDKAISASYNNSINAMEMLQEENPDARLEIIDTRCITMGLALLLRHMVQLREEGKSYEEVVSFARENAIKISHRFMIDDLQWLRRGGRLSNASAIVGSLLSIKPLVYVPDDGTLVAYAKVRGRKKAIRELLKSTEKDLPDEGEGREIIVGHSDCKEDGEKWKAMVEEKYPKAKSVTLMELGPTIACHVGPGFLSIVYLCKERNA
jgi:DegV family protein with EDD domain